jgi:hypothetical protein
MAQKITLYLADPALYLAGHTLLPGKRSAPSAPALHSQRLALTVCSVYAYTMENVTLGMRFVPEFHGVPHTCLATGKCVLRVDLDLVHTTKRAHLVEQQESRGSPLTHRASTCTLPEP